MEMLPTTWAWLLPRSSVEARVKTAVKRRLRRVIDRVMLPYVEQMRVAAAVPPPTTDDAATEGTVSDRFHALNHALRTVALEQAPKGVRSVASIGASGAWYFDWFEQCVGPVEVHYGVEAFEPKPLDLPNYVRWVTDTADHLDGLANGSVDMVYAGQTTEHLWADEFVGFVLEAHRVLAPEGWLVIDSPNRRITEHLHWSHGGHTVELTVDEIQEILNAAGFAVRRAEGIWRCRFDDRILQLEDDLEDDFSVTRRIVTARDNPEDSFIWWVEAQRADRVPDAAAVDRLVHGIYERHWAARVCRGMWPGPEPGHIPVSRGTSGAIAHSLPFPIHAGAWTLRLELADGQLESAKGLTVRLVAAGNITIHVLTAEGADVTRNAWSWTFEQPHLLFAVSIHLSIDRACENFSIRMPLSLRPITEES